MALTFSEKTTVDQDVPVLIVAKSSRRRDSLRTLVNATPCLRVIGQVDDTSSALDMAADHRPALLVLDATTLGDDAWTALRQIKTERPETRCLVLVDTMKQRRMAEATSADGVLINGFSIDEFFTAVDRLLSREV